MTDPRDPQARCQALAASLLWLFGQDQHLTYEDEQSINPAYALAPGALSPPPEEMERRAALVVASAVLRTGAYSDVPPPVAADLDAPIAVLNLPVRVRNVLRLLDATTVRKVTELTADQLLARKNFGETSLRLLRGRLASLGLRLRGE